MQPARQLHDRAEYSAGRRRVPGGVLTLRVGIVGFGLAGRLFHAPLIRAAGMNVTAVATTRPEAIDVGGADIKVFGGIDALLDQGDVDLVVIATPNHRHAEQAAAALRAGKHVVIDKPAALHSSQVAELDALAKVSRREVAVFHNRRWDGDFLTLQRMLASQTLGDISAFHMRWDRFRPQVPDRWRERSDSGGGVLLDLGPHMIDQALQLFGHPDWIQATVMAQRAQALVDDAFEILMAKGSLLISLGVSSLAAAAESRYRVLGSRGAFLKSGLDVQEQQLRDGRDPLAADFGREPASQFGTLICTGDPQSSSVRTETGCWLEFYRRMRASIESSMPVPVTLDEAQQVMSILEAARVSSESGRRVLFRPSSA